MNIYRIAQDNSNYESYDSAIVIAESEEIARLIHPSFEFSELDTDSKLTIEEKLLKLWNEDLSKYRDMWVGLDCLSNIDVDYVGKADDSIKDVLVLCSSFNSG